MEIEHTEITVKKIANGVYVATCNMTKPIKSEVNMRGHTEDIAKEKLRLFLIGEPYKHLVK